ncbi:MAG: hypothetical protein M5U01_40795 [Ardenticatenaceae bacterium]|nr:hypothetical protein [Ardenticatenaceae bacterium]
MPAPHFRKLSLQHALNFPWAWDQRLLLIGANLLFLGMSIAVFERETGINGVSKGAYTSWIAAMLLCAAALIRLMKRPFVPIPVSLRVWLGAGGAILFLMVFQSALNFSRYGLKSILLESLPWACTVLLPVLGDPRFADSWRRIFRWHAVMGVVVNLFLLTQSWDLVINPLIYRYQLIPVVGNGLGLLYAVPYLLFLYGDLRPSLRLVVSVGMIELLYLGLIRENRQAVFLVGVQLLLAVWIYWRGRISAASLRQNRNILASFLIIVSVFWFLQAVLPEVSHRMMSLETRFLLTEGERSITENVRWKEVSVFFEQLKPLEYVWGRGVSGTFDNTIIVQNPHFIHVGYVYAILKGGIPLLLLLLFGPVLVGVRALLSSREPYMLAASGMCAWLAVKLYTGNILSANATYYLALVCFGYCLYGLGSPGLYPGSETRYKGNMT